MIYLLDTNTLIYLIKLQPPSVATRVDALLPGDELAMSFVSWAELLLGAERSKRKAVVLAGLQRLVEKVPVRYPRGVAICEHYAQQAARLRQAGTPIGANDLWIASHALAEGAVLVTHNVREFQRIEGLTLQDWVA